MEHSRLGDDELAGLAAQGDERAFEELYRRHERALHRYCRSILHDDEDASDAVQNAMLGAVRALPSRTRDTGVRAWLYAIARNESITLLRRRRPTAGEEAALLVPVPAADVIALQREQAAQLVADLGTLSERQRGALVMRELADSSYKEIALLHNTSEHAVRQSVTEARTALREIAAGRDASCASIRPALQDRRRRSRAVRAHLKSCHQCQAIAAPVPAPSRHLVWGPVVALWFALKRTISVVAGDANAPGWIAGLSQSGAAKPAAAAGVALVAALSAVPLTDERPSADAGPKPKTEQRAEKKPEPASKPAATVAAKPAGSSGDTAGGATTVRTVAAAKRDTSGSDDAGDVPKSSAGKKVARSATPAEEDSDSGGRQSGDSGSGDDSSSGDDSGGGGGGRHDDGGGDDSGSDDSGSDSDWGHDGGGGNWGGGGRRGGHRGGGGGDAASASVRAEDCPEPQAEAAPAPPAAETPPAEAPPTEPAT